MKKISKEVIMYIIMGIGTTIVSLGSYYILANPLNLNYQLANIISWILAVTFAYITNKKYVFESKVNDMKGIFKEASSFYLARISTLLIEMASMFIFVTIFHFDANIIKLLNQGIVLVLNYVFSKLFVFKKTSTTSS
ncbi:MAG: GtrA family protein [Erysipelotrichaceae bacterium]|nr:GtrA family protein [Erysipelotrichaceae bacterium]